MDAPNSTYGPRDAFPCTQLVYLALAPVAIYTRAILSQDRLSAIRQTPPFEFPSSPTGELASDEKQAGRAKGKSDGSPAPPIEQSWKRSRALGGVVCCVLLVVDLLLLRARPLASRVLGGRRVSLRRESSPNLCYHFMRADTLASSAASRHYLVRT